MAAAAAPKRPRGIDVSHHQASIDWDQVKDSGITFAITKVSEGLGAPDSVFTKNKRWAAIRRVGLIRGAYHFARPQKGRDPADEVQEFLTVLDAAGGLADGDLVPVLDLEAFGANGSLTAKQTLEWTRGYVAELQAKIGRRPLIYTGSFWRDTMRNPADNLDCPLWLAAYVSKPNDFVPVAWKDEGWTMWQKTNVGTCPGVPGNCLLDVTKTAAGLDSLRL